MRPVGDRPGHANVDSHESGAGIPLIDLKKLNGPPEERRKVVEAIGRACESDGFFMVTNHGIPAGVVEGMLRVAREFFHLPESERRLSKCYSDDPKKAVAVRLADVRTEKVSNWRDFLRLHCYPLESFVDQWPANPPSFRQVVSAYATEARALALRLLEPLSESLGLERSHSHSHSHSHMYWMQALSNDRYKSVPYRVIDVNSESERISVPTSFYWPYPDLVDDGHPLAYRGFSISRTAASVATATGHEADASNPYLVGIVGSTFVLPVNMKDINSSWETKWKVLFGIFMMLSLLSAVSSIICAMSDADSRARTFSDPCSWFGLIVASALFAVYITCQLGTYGYVAAGPTAALVVLFLALLWWKCSAKPSARRS